MWSGKLRDLREITHQIQLHPDAQPVYSATYRDEPHRRQEIENQVRTMLDLGVIKPLDFECSVPVVVLPKPSRHFRYFGDYHRLMERTVKDVYLIPRMEDFLDSLGDATMFSTLDCTSGYWKITMATEDRDETTFMSPKGLFRFLRHRFGLVNAPASFQRSPDILFSGLRWKTILVYLKDLIVSSLMVEDHIWHRQDVLLLLEKAGVSLILSKCSLFQKNA